MEGKRKIIPQTKRLFTILDSGISKECVMLPPSTHCKTYRFLKVFILLGIIFI